ncbi:MAG: ATP-binding protein [Bryobacteraceae bacterium]
MSKQRRMARKLLRILASVGVIAGITGVYLALNQVNHTTVALTQLMGVLGIAARWGLLEAITASLASMMFAAYFWFPPIGNIAIHDPENWVTVGAFLGVSVVASQLSASVRKKATEALAREAEVERLYELSRGLMQADAGEAIGRDLVELIARIVEVEGVRLFDMRSGRMDQAGTTLGTIPESTLRLAAAENRQIGSAASGMVFLPIELSGEPIGSIALCGAGLTDHAVRSVSNLAGIALERARAMETAAHAEAVRQSQELKSLLLDAVAHDFKTPLTSIKFGASVLRSDSSLAPEQRELAEVMEEETDRLTSMISQATQVARIQSGGLQLQRNPIQPAHLIMRALTRMRPLLDDRPFERSVPTDLPLIEADQALLSIALSNLVENAIKYSPGLTPIGIDARLEGENMVFSVSDKGPGVSPEERVRIFDRYYRGKSALRIQGTGMGLAIATEIVDLHGGRIWVENLPEGGARFSISLPLKAQPQPA